MATARRGTALECLRACEPPCNGATPSPRAHIGLPARWQSERAGPLQIQLLQVEETQFGIHHVGRGKGATRKWQQRSLSLCGGQGAAAGHGVWDGKRDVLDVESVGKGMHVGLVINILQSGKHRMAPVTGARVKAATGICCCRAETDSSVLSDNHVRMSTLGAVPPLTCHDKPGKRSAGALALISAITPASKSTLVMVRHPARHRSWLRVELPHPMTRMRADDGKPQARRLHSNCGSVPYQSNALPPRSSKKPRQNSGVEKSDTVPGNSLVGAAGAAIAPSNGVNLLSWRAGSDLVTGSQHSSFTTTTAVLAP